MNKDIAIKVESLSKRYQIQTVKPGFTLRDKLTELGKPKPQTEDFWALSDVSFNVFKGEVLGIIGKNGSGKSTLLKILSRITEPTRGKITLHGRVASLLEVGTGFNPEMSGRENIFLNGAILGMTRKEIRHFFDEIIAFSGVEKFLDTPVKRYSSGMYVRLAFAIAAHLQSEILLVDEVLAVGDAEFQEKCLGKMNTITQDGRTVLFVSHNLEAVRSLCHRVLFLHEGKVKNTGPTDIVISQYISTQSQQSNTSNTVVFPSNHIIRKAWIEDEHETITSSINSGASMRIKFAFNSSFTLTKPAFGFEIADAQGRKVTSITSYLLSSKRYLPTQEGVVTCFIPHLQLLPGTYLISLTLAKEMGYPVDTAEYSLKLEVLPHDIFDSGIPMEAGHGIFYLPASIELEQEGVNVKKR